MDLIAALPLMRAMTGLTNDLKAKATGGMPPNLVTFVCLAAVNTAIMSLLESMADDK